MYIQMTVTKNSRDEFTITNLKSCMFRVVHIFQIFWLYMSSHSKNTKDVGWWSFIHTYMYVYCMLFQQLKITPELKLPRVNFCTSRITPIKHVGWMRSIHILPAVRFSFKKSEGSLTKATQKWTTLVHKQSN